MKDTIKTSGKRRLNSLFRIILIAVLRRSKQKKSRQRSGFSPL